jgi:predicted RNase H-like HicB family nuclease
MTYLIIYEKTTTGFSAYVPDLPGCIATGLTKELAARNIKEAVNFHIEGMQEEGLEIPTPISESELMEVV